MCVFCLLKAKQYWVITLASKRVASLQIEDENNYNTMNQTLVPERYQMLKLHFHRVYCETEI